MDFKHDSAFLEILREEKNITNFLDSFFGFLFRCTDFYVESTSNQQLGFPPGIAEKLVLNTLRKWKNLKMLPEPSMDIQASLPHAIEEVTIGNDKVAVIESPNSLKSCFKKDPSPKSCTDEKSDSYNGASYDNYSWSQSISELEVSVPIPPSSQRSKDIRVVLNADELEISVLKNLLTKDSKIDDVGSNEIWNVLVKGRFLYRIKNTESYWCLEPGKHVNLHLEKTQERWWDALLLDEPRISLSKIDCTRKLEEMPESEQMKVEELVWNQRRKLLGQPTSEQIRMERILKQAWNADGSPFKGTEYDHSILKFN